MMHNFDPLHNDNRRVIENLAYEHNNISITNGSHPIQTANMSTFKYTMVLSHMLIKRKLVPTERKFKFYLSSLK